MKKIALRYTFLFITAMCLSGLAGCSMDTVPEAETSTAHETGSSGRTLTVLAAASLTEPFTELGRMFEAQNPGVKVRIGFGGSQQLAQQLDQGAEADVFASASEKYMDAAVAAGRVAKGNAQIFAKNRLVVIFPGDNPAGITVLTDLARPGLKLDLANPSVPAGKYTLDFLEQASREAEFGAEYADRVLGNVVSYEDNVKSVVTKIRLGEADAGIVYISDISGSAGEDTGRLDIPDRLNPEANYPIAAVADSKNSDLAGAFVELALSPQGQTVMVKYGFIAAGAAEK